MRSVDESIAAAREASYVAFKKYGLWVSEDISSGGNSTIGAHIASAAIDSMAEDLRDYHVSRDTWKMFVKDRDERIAKLQAEIARLKANAIPDGPPTPEQALKMAKAFWPGVQYIAKDSGGSTYCFTIMPEFGTTINAAWWSVGGETHEISRNIVWPANLPASERICPVPEKPLAVGDWVVWRTGTTLGQIMAVSEKSAWVKWGKDDHYNTWPIKDIRRAIPDEIKEANDED